MNTNPTIEDFFIPEKTFGDVPFQITDPSSNSSGTFSYTSSDTTVVTISGDQITIVGAGTSTITATQTETDDFNSGTITVALVVNKLTPTLTNFTVTEKTFGDASFQITEPSSNSSGTFSYTSSDTTVVTISGDQITIVGAGTSTITATQAETDDFNTETITVASVVNKLTPTLTNFTVTEKTFGEVPFLITEPSSNSSGTFSYASSDTRVAILSKVINGNVIINGIGNSTITVTQEETNNFTSTTQELTFTVNPSSSTNPVIIDNVNSLLYFLRTTSTHCKLEESLNVDYDLVTSRYKKIIGNNVQIYRVT